MHNRADPEPNGNNAKICLTEYLPPLPSYRHLGIRVKSCLLYYDLLYSFENSIEQNFAIQKRQQEIKENKIETLERSINTPIKQA